MKYNVIIFTILHKNSNNWDIWWVLVVEESSYLQRFFCYMKFHVLQPSNAHSTSLWIKSNHYHVITVHKAVTSTWNYMEHRKLTQQCCWENTSNTQTINYHRFIKTIIKSIQNAFFEHQHLLLRQSRPEMLKHSRHNLSKTITNDKCVYLGELGQRNWGRRVINLFVGKN